MVLCPYGRVLRSESIICYKILMKMLDLHCKLSDAYLSISKIADLEKITAQVPKKWLNQSHVIHIFKP